MAMHACPHCGGPGITTFRRYSLGPAVPATCQSCGRKIGVPWTSLLAMLPFFVGMQAARLLPGVLSLVLPIVGMIAMLVLWRYVPLEKR
jgi:predicted RNA-binding Zn-ribbon protein involved in translation (DUF1610 family)